MSQIIYPVTVAVLAGVSIDLTKKLRAGKKIHILHAASLITGHATNEGGTAVYRDIACTALTVTTAAPGAGEIQLQSTGLAVMCGDNLDTYHVLVLDIEEYEEALRTT